jgi:hypothetical protein
MSLKQAIRSERGRILRSFQLMLKRQTLKRLVCQKTACDDHFN